jgi:hypothetical protein
MGRRPLPAVRDFTRDGSWYILTMYSKCTQEKGGGICAETGYPLKLPSLTNLARLGHFPTASQAGRLAGPVFYVHVYDFSLVRKLSLLEISEESAPSPISSRPNLSKTGPV